VVVAALTLEHGFAVNHPECIDGVVLAIQRHGFDLFRPRLCVGLGAEGFRLGRFAFNPYLSIPVAGQK